MNEELKKILNKMLQEMAYQTDLMEQLLDKVDEISSSYSDYFVEDEDDEDVIDYVDEDDEYGFYDPDDVEGDDE